MKDEEPAAWEDIVARYERPLVGYARQFTGDLESARDVAQETFLAMLRTPREDLHGRLRAWLFTVCRNRAIDRLRKEARMQPLAPETPLAATSPPPLLLTEAQDEARRVLALLGELPEKQREALRLKFQSGLRYREIAEIMGLTTSYVGVLIHEALKTLRAKARA